MLSALVTCGGNSKTEKKLKHKTPTKKNPERLGGEGGGGVGVVSLGEKPQKRWQPKSRFRTKKGPYRETAHTL